MTLSLKEFVALRYSLVFVWLATALASVWELDGQSLSLLTAAGVHNPLLAQALILGGAGADVVLALAMLMKPVRATYWAALVLMLGMTLVATVLDPSLWLHPLGPLTKNVPIAVILWVLAKARA
ncbi:DoxX-like family protein [Rhodoferax sp. OV413]|uniref:DoxX-like family protein n=1 Tax=Rhodoferax sp. OV413 TaxID=1855285 RepID=UPI0008921AD4|nr:DoxX-like family protein [Rhodoferax sp. OV413]SDP36236.1 DoxX-like family protein [Rhodoferax sp. OV413]